MALISLFINSLLVNFNSETLVTQIISKKYLPIPVDIDSKAINKVKR